jgi:DNA-binding response OmpR family regulator
MPMIPRGPDRAPAVAAGASPLSGQVVAQRRTLVVDDEPAIPDTVADLLGDEGYAVETAVDGELALVAIDRARPAAILLDLGMPVLDGWDVARALGERGIAVPIVVMTAATSARAWCDEIGADGCLPKPFELDDLMRAVERVAGRPGLGGGV